MPKNVKPSRISSKFRWNLSKEMDEAGITPVTNNDKFAGVFISVPDLDEKTAARLHEKLKFNPVAGINEILEQ